MCITHRNFRGFVQTSANFNFISVENSLKLATMDFYKYLKSKRWNCNDLPQYCRNGNVPVFR